MGNKVLYIIMRKILRHVALLVVQSGVSLKIL